MSIWQEAHKEAAKQANKIGNKGVPNKKKSFIKANQMKIATGLVAGFSLTGLVMVIIWIYKLVLWVCI